MRLSSNREVSHTARTTGISFSEHIRQAVDWKLSWTDLRERVEYTGSDSLLKDVQADCFDASDFRNATPILSTVWVGTCIAVAGYDRNRKAWFLTHIVSPEDVGRLFDGALAALGACGALSEMEFSLVWWMKGWRWSEATVLEIYRYMSRKSLAWHITHESLFPAKKRPGYFDSTSLLLDTRNGDVYFYPDKISE